MTPSLTTPTTTIDVTGLSEPMVQSIQQLVAILRSNGPQVGSPRRPLRGRLAGMNLTIPTAADVEELRREMWANFPRDLPDSSQK